MNRREFLRGAAVAPVAAVAAGVATAAGVQPNPVGPFRIENEEGGFFEISYSDDAWHIKTSEMYAMEREHDHIDRIDAVTIQKPQQLFGGTIGFERPSANEFHLEGITGITL